MSNGNVRKRIYKLVGERIRDVRRNGAKRLTQQELATASNGEIRRSTIANIERGRQPASLYQLYVISRILDVEPNEFLPERPQVYGDEADPLKLLDKELSPKARQWAGRVINKATRKETDHYAKPSRDRKKS